MSDGADEFRPTTITVFGRRAVMEALATREVEVEEVIVAGRAPAAFRRDLAGACRERGVTPITADGRHVSERSGDARNDQGVCAEVRLTLVSEVEAFAESLTGAGARRPARLLALDGVTNPQNVGMIVRSALGAGMAGVLWPSRGAPWISGLIVKASASTIYRCPIVRCGALEEGLWGLKGAGFNVVGLDARAETPVDAHEPAHRAVYVVGSETEGLSDGALECLDERVRIPLRAGVESLNAAVAAALVCYAACRDLPEEGERR